MRIGLIGAGNIGTFLLNAINRDHLVPDSRIVCIFDERTDKADRLTKLAEEYHCTFVQDRETFLRSDLDLVIEAAEPKIAQKYAKEVVRHGIHFLIISVGALVDSDFVQELEQICKENHCKIYVPSGAIGGMDVFKGAKALGVDEIHEARLITRKSPASLGVELNGEDEVVIFSGTAEEAIEKFPKNINVAITLSLAGIGVEKTKVQIIADRKVTKNTHEIVLTGTFGEMRTVVSNEPLPQNPRTSSLAALSTLAMLQQMNQPIVIG